MRTVIQRVQHASVAIDGAVRSEIRKGLLILVGFEDSDTDKEIVRMAKKIVNMRIFDDDKGVMNRSVLEIGGEILIVSQFTLYASTKKGNRPSYIRAAKPDIAIPLYESFCKEVEMQLGREVKTGIFGVDMKVYLLNDGPVTIIVDTKD